MDLRKQPVLFLRACLFDQVGNLSGLEFADPARRGMRRKLGVPAEREKVAPVGRGMRRMAAKGKPAIAMDIERNRRPAAAATCEPNIIGPDERTPCDVDHALAKNVSLE